MTATPPFPIERTAVVTGAASARGIGRATAHQLAAGGWSVAVLDLDDAACRATAAELADRHGVDACGVVANIADQASVDEAISRVEQDLPPVVGLASVAGVSSPTEFLDVSATEGDRVLDINLQGTFLVTQRLMRGNDRAAARSGGQRELGVRAAGRRHVLEGAVQGGQGGNPGPDPGR